MKALVILYDGSEIQSYVLDQMIIALANDPKRKVAEAYRLSDEEMASALASRVLPSQTLIRDESDQTAIDHAATYIAETVLTVSTNPIKVSYLIGLAISGGDEKMRNAIEIIATKSGTVREPKFTKSIISAIKQLYETFKCA